MKEYEIKKSVMRHLISPTLSKSNPKSCMFYDNNHNNEVFYSKYLE